MEKKDKEPVFTNEDTDTDTHIIYFMLFNIIAYFLFV